MSKYIELEDYECTYCRNEGRCGSCPNNDERIREWQNNYGSNDCSNWNGYGFNITD